MDYSLLLITAISGFLLVLLGFFIGRIEKKERKEKNEQSIPFSFYVKALEKRIKELTAKKI